MTTSMLV